MVLSTLGILYGVGQDDIESSLPDQLRNAKGTDGQPIYNMATTVALLLFVLLYFPCIGDRRMSGNDELTVVAQ